VSKGTLTGVTGRGGGLSIGVEERGINGLQDGALVSVFESTVAVCPLKCLFRRMQLFVAVDWPSRGISPHTKKAFEEALAFGK
jgi:hypothetical protein